MKLKSKLALAVAAGALVGSIAYADTPSSDVLLIEQVAQSSWDRMLGATWYNPPHALGTADANQEYKYTSYDSVASLKTACDQSSINNAFGWDFAKMSPAVNGVVQARQGVPVTFRVDPEITWEMQNVELKNYWTSWWFNDNSVVPVSGIENVTMSHTFITAGTHSVFVLENYEDQYSGGILPATFQDSAPVSCNYITVNVTPDHAPVARIVVGTVSNATVAFNGSHSSDADGDDLTYTWHFDDGSVSHAVNVTHTFTNATTVASDHTATLTVSDGFMHDGASATVTVSVPRDIGGCGNLPPGTQCQ